jgi:hypothetical protein
MKIYDNTLETTKLAKKYIKKYDKTVLIGEQNAKRDIEENLTAKNTF